MRRLGQEGNKATGVVRTEGLVPRPYQSNTRNGDAAVLISSVRSVVVETLAQLPARRANNKVLIAAVPVNIGRRVRGPGKNWRRRPLGSTCDAVQSGECSTYNGKAKVVGRRGRVPESRIVFGCAAAKREREVVLSTAASGVQELRVCRRQRSFLRVQRATKVEI